MKHMEGVVTTTLHLRHLVLGTPLFEEQLAFYEEIWGLQPASESQDGVRYFRGALGGPAILGLIPARRRVIHHIGFAAEDVAAVDRLWKQVQARGARVLGEPGALDEPEGGYGFRMLDLDGRCLEIAAEFAAGSAEASPSRSYYPRALNHVVLNTPDIDRAAAFYTEVLGFRISDWSEHAMAFLRCDHNHHSIAVNQAPHASINHVAFEVGSVDEMLRGLAHVRRNWRAPIWGPGRHGPGNNTFAYFQDAAGFVVEYTAELQQIADESLHQPQVWPRIPERMDLWGIGGPPEPGARRAMLGQADPGWEALPASLESW